MARRPPWLKRELRGERAARKAGAGEQRAALLETRLADQRLAREVDLRKLVSDLRQIEAVYGSLRNKEREARVVDAKRLPSISIGAGIGNYEDKRNEVLRALVMLHVGIVSGGKMRLPHELVARSGKPIVDVTDALERCLGSRANAVRFQVRSQLEARLGTRLPLSGSDVESFMERLPMRDKAAYITILRNAIEKELPG